MKGRQIILGNHEGQDGRARPAAALVEDGRLMDLLIDVDDAVPPVGTIYRAICDRPVKGQGGMFVKLGDGLTGFHRNAKGLAPGQALLVQVNGYAELGKAIPVTDRVLVKSRYCIATPHAPGVNVARSIGDDAARDDLLELAHEVVPDRGRHGIILRSACANADLAAVADDLEATWQAAMAVLSDEGQRPERLLDGPDAQTLAWRDWPTAQVSHHWDQAADLVDALRGGHVGLGQASAVIEPTRAFVAVDVNTPEGGAGGLKANLALAADLPRHLRLRGLGGQVVIDLAPMAKKDRRGFEAALRSACRADPVETSLIGWTPLGHFELTRRRERRPLEMAL